MFVLTLFTISPKIYKVYKIYFILLYFLIIIIIFFYNKYSIILIGIIILKVTNDIILQDFK